MTEATPAQSQDNGRREMIAILDFGSQYSRLIARRMRECHVYCELLPASTSLATTPGARAKGVILSGGPDSVYAPGARRVEQAILESDLPVLGICYGMQLLAHQLGGRVAPQRGGASMARARSRRMRRARRTIPLFAGWRGRRRGLDVWMSHGDSVGEPPPGFAPLARSQSGALAAMADEHGRYRLPVPSRGAPHAAGRRPCRKLPALRVCGCAPTWTAGAFIEEAVAAHPRSGGKRPRDLRPLRRRGFSRGGGPGPRP